MGVLPGRPQHAGRHRRTARSDTGAGPCHRPRCRRWIRRQAGHDTRGGPGRLAGHPARPSHAVGRNPDRASAGVRRRTRADPDGDDRRYRRRPVAGVQARRDPGHGGLPVELRLPHAPDDPHDGLGLLRHRPGRVHQSGRAHEHGAGRGVPRGGPTRGRGRPGTHDRAVRRRSGARPRRGAPDQLRAPRAVPVHDADGRQLRLRRLRVGDGPGARIRRVPRSPRRAGAATGRGRSSRHGHRHLELRGDHQPRWQRRVRRHRGPRRRHRDRAHGHVAPWPGPRDGMVDDRQRPHRDPADADLLRLRRHRPRPTRRWNRWFALAPGRRLRSPSGHRGARRSGPGPRRRPAGGERG